MRSKNQIRLKTSKTMSKRIAGKRPANRRQAARKTALGSLPEWNLADLYSGLDDPAIKRDLDRADAECVAFEDAYKGKLAELAQSPAGRRALAEAVRRYEAIDDLTGRLGSYAGLVARRQYGRSGAHQILRRRAGAADRRLHASAVLFARAQPHRRRADRSGDDRSGAGPLPAVARGRAPLPALSAGRSRRAAVPRKIDDGLFRLESAVRRDDRQSALQGFGQVARHRADAQSAAGPLGRKAQGRGAGAWRTRSRTTCSSSR